MQKLLQGAALALLVIGAYSPARAADTDPVVGTWQLNPSKSSFTAGPALKSQMRTYSQSGKSIILVMKSVGPDGSEVTMRTTYELNGKDFPTMGTPDYDSLSGTQLDTNTARFTLKKNGKVVGATTRTLSKDGKTMTVKTKLTTASGEKTESTLVFDKQ